VKSTAVSDDFFVPELCQPEALLGLVLLAELLVFVLVLAEPMQPGFNWMRLALTSLFVQWIVLLLPVHVTLAWVLGRTPHLSKTQP